METAAVRDNPAVSDAIRKSDNRMKIRARCLAPNPDVSVIGLL
jgi:hypothetical protein